MAIPSGTEAVRAFIPAMDFNSSKAFYEALGFKILLDGELSSVWGTALSSCSDTIKKSGPKTA
jgi:hypothetical protein